MVRRWVWICVLLLLENSLSIQITDPVLYYNSLPELNNIYYENCAPELACDPTPVYRTANGSCNDQAHTSWGSSLTPYIRLSIPVYDDNVNKIRQRQMDGSMLPGPRDIQVRLFLYRSQDIPDLFNNVHFSQLGQWITHDITLMPPADTGSKDCCLEPFPDTIPECQAIIKVPIDDPVYGKSGRKCINNIRLVTSESFNCDIIPRIPMNQATAFIDASQLYGHQSDVSTQIRAFVGGKLLTDIIHGQEFCPQEIRNGSSTCDDRPHVKYCFFAGDPRVNQHFGIIAYQTVFTRFHNKLADLLNYINPKWTDEKLYQECRKIMGAIIQILTYCYYLPRLLGEEYTESVGLAISEYERTVYDPSLMPQLTIEFAAGIFRLPHNSVVKKYNFVNKNNHVFKSSYLNENMMNPDPLVLPHNFDGLIRGMTLSSEREPTHSYNYEISNFMFDNLLPYKSDQDLLSMDIERGRETGIATYNMARVICGYKKADTFMDFTDILEESDALKLQDVYATPDDVDLLVGALLEPLCPGALVGQISRSIIGDVFYRLRYGDSHFFDIQDQPGSFSDQQLEALRKIDLGLILCATTGVKEVPTDIFAPQPLESMQSCQERLLNLDLSAWEDTS